MANADFDQIPSNTSFGASQSVRRNSANSAFELFTATADGLLPSQSGNSGKFLTTNGSAASWASIATGITIGSTAISSGTNNRVLFQLSGVVSQGNLEFSGSELKVLNGTKHVEMSLDSNYRAVFGHAFSSGDNVEGYTFKYFRTGSPGYGTSGLAIEDVGYGYKTVLNQLASGTLYITDGSGSPGSLSLGTWENPYDGTTLTNGSGFWTLTGGNFGIGITPSEKLHVNGHVKLEDAKDFVIGTSTGSKLGQSGSKIGFWGVTPVTQRTIFGGITDATGGTSGTTINIDDGMGGIDVAALNDALATIINRLNATRNILLDVGIAA